MQSGLDVAAFCITAARFHDIGRGGDAFPWVGTHGYDCASPTGFLRENMPIIAYHEMA